MKYLADSGALHSSPGSFRCGIVSHLRWVVLYKTIKEFQAHIYIIGPEACVLAYLWLAGLSSVQATGNTILFDFRTSPIIKCSFQFYSYIKRSTPQSFHVRVSNSGQPLNKNNNS